jgi:hypothetical protein
MGDHIDSFSLRHQSDQGKHVASTRNVKLPDAEKRQKKSGEPYTGCQPFFENMERKMNGGAPRRFHVYFAKE